METERQNGLVCQNCDKEFSSTSTKNRHIRKFHPKFMELTKKKRIICPMCPNEEKFSFHTDLLNHLTDRHDGNIKESVLNFRNLEEFTVWKELENIEVDYACRTRNKLPNGEENIWYDCNRSDSKGFVSSCNKRRTKTGGSIRIHGICPSRIKVKIFPNGEVMVKFTETHMGHDDELRNKRLSKAEQNHIVDQLAAGVTNNRIMQNAIKIEDIKLERNECSTSQLHYEDDKTYFIEESLYSQDNKIPISFNERREITISEITNFSRTLDEHLFEKFVAGVMKLKNNIWEEQESERICKKIKIEEET